MKRNLPARTTLLSYLLLTGSMAFGQSSFLEIYLVGTGGPELTSTRGGEATLVRANGQNLLFDAGRDVLQGLYQCRIRPQSVTRIFLTHLHSDHIEGLPGLWITPWFLLGRKEHLQVWGPVGTKVMIDGMRRMYSHDLDQRVNDSAKREYLDIEIHEVTAGQVYGDSGITVTAVPVEHHDGNPACGYRISANGRSVLLTGDATFTDELAKAGHGVDVLISNVAAGTRELEDSGKIGAVLDKLMRPEQAAKLFSADRPRLAVYSHIVKKGMPGKRGDDAVMQRTRAAGYAGALQMGTDRMEILVGDSIRIKPPASPQDLPDFDSPGSTFPVKP